MKNFGIHYREYIRELLTIKKANITLKLLHTSQFELLLDDNNAYNDENINWISYYFDKQNINPADFLAWLQIIKTQNVITRLIL